MKTSTLLLILFLSFLYGAPVHSQMGACGGTIEPQNDCSGNGRKYHVICCPENHRQLGVAYTDMKDQDHVDAVSAVCISPTNDVILASDFSRTPKQFTCEYYERVVGIESKDVMTESGNLYDELDGLTVFCQKPGDSAIRKVPNRDLESKREGREIKIPYEKQALGIAYKEMEKGSSDRADCVTLITK